MEKYGTLLNKLRDPTSVDIAESVEIYMKIKITHLKLI